MIKIWIRRGMLGLVLLGGVVGMSGIGPPSAQAIPLSGDYIITSGAFQGTFTIDPSTHLFTNWDLSFPGFPPFSIPSATFLNCCDLAFLNSGNTIESVIIFGDFHTDPFQYELSVSDLLTYHVVEQKVGTDDFYEAPPGEFAAVLSVPEPAPFALLMIGLLILAGARWWTHRQQGLQRG